MYEVLLQWKFPIIADSSRFSENYNKWSIRTREEEEIEEKQKER